MSLRLELAAELDRRCKKNPRYSLRAYASWLGLHHTTLSRILREQRLTPRMIRTLGARLGLSKDQIRDVCIEENAIRILSFVKSPAFTADSRRIAVMTGVPLDGVNASIHWLLHTRRITMVSPTKWNTTEA